MKKLIWTVALTLCAVSTSHAMWGDWFLEQCCRFTGIRWCCEEHNGDDYPWPE